MSAFDKAFHNVQALVSTFSSNIHHYMSPGYSEAEARQDFIDNFFTALGWDVRHKHQTNPYEQEVKIEKSQKQQNESARKRADYAFFIGPNYKDEVFFAEAKKPSVLIGNNPQHYFQTIKYGWNSGCPICALTDFEEFAIIDCRQKPDIKYALNGKHKVFKYTDYTDKEKFAEIYWLFSREAVAANSIQKYAAALPKPKGKIVQKALFKGGYQAIDDSFLEYIDGIRENIAKAFKKANENLNSEELTEATQRTVDRLVFIRFLEDKFIEPEEHVSEWKSWKHFITDCRRLDAKYNGVVFKEHFIDKPHFIGADEKLFLDICSDISGLNSPYDFNYIPIHILGSIYERFLGKIVVATNKRVHIEEKPEVRKAGGVYYTPKYIVDYIVKNTVGKIIEGLTPAQIAGKQPRTKDTAKAFPLRGGLEGVSPLAFADIACGSGSFLIGVYDYLLDYHKQYYTEKLAGKSTLDARSEDFGNVDYKDGQWVLSLKLKQDILINNIYGVDIDRQAVEVTQLSLFLKMLEDESLSSTTVKQGAMFSKVLPDLSKNIICGNSLIGWDIMQGQLFENDELKKLNPMDYETAFPLVMKNGGFDAVVGNPPYVRQEGLGMQKEYFQKKYKVYHGMADLYTYFFEKGISLLRNNGLFSIIVANKWMRANYGEPLRRWLVEQQLLEIVDFGDLPVFQNATTYPCIPTLLKTSERKVDEKRFFSTSVKNLDFYTLNDYVINNRLSLKKSNLDNKGWILNNNETSDFINRIKEKSITFKEYINKKLFIGLKTGLNEAFIIDPTTAKKVLQHNRTYEEFIKPYLVGRDIKRYEPLNVNKYLVVIPSGWSRRNNVHDFKSLKAKMPQVANLLEPFSEKAKRRTDQGEFWWELRPCVYYNEFEREKILFAEIALRGQFSLDSNSNYCDMTAFVVGSNSKYLLGVLNSKLITFLFTSISSQIRGGFLRWKRQYVEQIPIIPKPPKNLNESIVSLVTQILEAKKQLAATVTESDKNFLQNKCNSLDRQIDKLVYELYGLTDEEIRIVEGQ